MGDDLAGLFGDCQSVDIDAHCKDMRRKGKATGLVMSKTSHTLASVNLSDVMTKFLTPQQEHVQPASAQAMLPPEPQTGNIEYKLTLAENLSAHRLDQLVTQMNWRIKEGSGQAIYEIGVSDDGKMVGLSPSQMETSLNVLKLMAAELNASITVLRQRILVDGKLVNQVFVRKNTNDNPQTELRVAFLGSAGAGKSTLISVLANGTLDDSLGSARLSMLRHRHEVLSGHTSCISRAIFGYDHAGNVISGCNNRSPEEVLNLSSVIVNQVDLSGTKFGLSLSGLTANLPHLALLVIDAEREATLQGTTREHLNLILAMNLPFIIIINKIDLVELQVNQIIEQLREKINQQLSDKEAVWIQNPDQINELSGRSKLVPMIAVSCTNGKNLESIYTQIFAFLASSDTGVNDKIADNTTAGISSIPKFYIDEIFHKNVVSGILAQGTIRVGDALLIGPDQDGKFHATAALDIKKHKAAKMQIFAGQSGTIKLSLTNFNNIRKGMVLTNAISPEKVCLSFRAKIRNLGSNIGLRKGCQFQLFIRSIRQQVCITKILNKKTRIGKNERAIVEIQFVKQPEFIKEGDRFLLNNNNHYAIGKILKAYSFQP